MVGLLSALVIDRLTAWNDRDIELVRAVRNLALDEFVGETDSQELVDDALRGMLSGLDPYSRYYGPEEIARLDRETTGEFRGIGVVFRQPTTDGQVLFPFPGSPAAQAGIRVGDRFLTIAGQLVADMEPGGLQRAIQRSGGDVLEATVLGLDEVERAVRIQPESVLDPTVRHAQIFDPERGLGYLALISFTHRTPEEFDEAVASLREQGLERLVIDLRNNPGGILEAAVRVANRFIEEGTIVATRTRQATEITEARAAEAHLAGLPLVLLVDSGSASASEVLAGALQDHCVAAVVGESTYGKGTVQTLRRVGEDRAIVKLTTANYFTPSWRRIERQSPDDLEAGIDPDLVVELTPQQKSDIHVFLDTYSPPPVHREAISAWAASLGEPLLAERPEDPQLEAALKLLAADDELALREDEASELDGALK